MKVIFLSDVPRVGRRNDIKEVNDGYALNFLFPKKLATPATAQAIKNLETQKQDLIIGRQVQETLLLKNLEELKGKTITLSGKANDKGHLFSAIHVKEIVSAMKGEHGVEISEDLISLEKPIKEVGEFEIPIKIGGKKSFFKLLVKAS